MGGELPNVPNWVKALLSEPLWGVRAQNSFRLIYILFLANLKSEPFVASNLQTVDWYGRGLFGHNIFFDGTKVCLLKCVLGGGGGVPWGGGGANSIRIK